MQCNCVAVKLVRQYSLILHGNAGLGKTPLAMSLMGEIAIKEQHDAASSAYFIKVSTLDSLRDAKQSFACLTNIYDVS